MIPLTNRERHMVRYTPQEQINATALRGAEPEFDVVSAAATLLSLAPHAASPLPDCARSFSRKPLFSSKARSFPQSSNLPPMLVTLPPSGVVSWAESSGSDTSLDGNQSDCSGSSSDDRFTASAHGQHNSSPHASPPFFTGTISLALDTDEESLSPIHCFMRRYCVEAFSATEGDVSTPRGGQPYGNRVSIGQVGIRCLHCKNRPHHERQERAVCFPSSLKNIYHSIETWQRRHSLVCQDIPDWIKRSMIDLMEKSKTGAGGRRKYWEESAGQLGMATTDDGIRFVGVPGDSCKFLTHERHSVNATLGSKKQWRKDPTVEVVRQQDRQLVTDYLFLLLDQMEMCSFTEDDRSGGRSKVKNCEAGYPGMQCKHCEGKAGFGRYFPATCQALTSANSDRNIHNHLVKCRRCPPYVQEELVRLHEQQQRYKNRRGGRKQFFQRVWARMHPNNTEYV